ncbi:MAG: hypothetical protein BV456_04640 [Thermoplasmata archaeon M8B2D]|nr:MAG: hypothetical protein BV456_04640 [Thermoplasmata archaeon M8B2D]
MATKVEKPVILDILEITENLKESVQKPYEIPESTRIANIATLKKAEKNPFSDILDCLDIFRDLSYGQKMTRIGNLKKANAMLDLLEKPWYPNDVIFAVKSGEKTVYYDKNDFYNIAVQIKLLFSLTTKILVSCKLLEYGQVESDDSSENEPTLESVNNILDEILNPKTESTEKAEKVESK